MFAKYAPFALKGSTVVQKQVMPLFYVVAVAEQVLGVCFTQRLFELRAPLRMWREHRGTDSPHLSVLTSCLKGQLYNSCLLLFAANNRRVNGCSRFFTWACTHAVEQFERLPQVEIKHLRNHEIHLQSPSFSLFFHSSCGVTALSNSICIFCWVFFPFEWLFL